MTEDRAKEDASQSDLGIPASKYARYENVLPLFVERLAAEDMETLGRLRDFFEIIAGLVENPRQTAYLLVTSSQLGCIYDAMAEHLKKATSQD